MSADIVGRGSGRGRSAITILRSFTDIARRTSMPGRCQQREHRVSTAHDLQCLRL